MAYYKFTVVGGVAIPNYVKAIAALTGINGCLFYRYSHGMDSKYGVKLPKQLTRFVAGTSAILAGHTAYDLYEFNKLLERMDRVEFEKMRAGKHQKFRAFSMLLLSGAMSLATVTGYMVYKFHMDFEKKRAMEEKEKSANPYSVCEWLMAALCKFSVVGGVAIPNYVKASVALTGFNGCLFYCYSRHMDSKYGVKLPKDFMGYVRGMSTVLAGHAACDLYEFNKSQLW